MEYKIVIEKDKNGYTSEVILKNGDILYVNANSDKQTLIEETCDAYPDYTSLEEI